MVGIPGKTTLWKKGLSEAFGDDSSWFGEQFYVNKFFRDKEDEVFINEEQ